MKYLKELEFQFYRTELLLDMLEKLDTGIALSVAISIRYGVVYTNTPDPHSYMSAANFLEDAQAVAFVRKNPWVYPKDASLSAVALRKFLECEDLCKNTNITFKNRAFSFEDRSLLNLAAHYCGSILKEFEFGDPDFGPGSTLYLAGRDSYITKKLVTKPECTALAYHGVLETIVSRMSHYAISCEVLSRERGSLHVSTTKLPIVQGNRFTTVPKDCRSDRPICIEPMGNMLMQKAIGSTIRRRLRRWGLDLDTQQERNRELARIGSRDDSYATIDLSSASDTISSEFVRFMLPVDWFDACNRYRSHRTELPDGTIIYNEKFSSMGNGFTFELESLLFLSISLAFRKVYGKESTPVGVFGDDIIIDKSYASQLCAFLERIGFLVNSEKSFLNGPFRESCGGDYYLGLAVRPTYFKELPDERYQRIFHVANLVRDVASKSNFSLGCNTLFKPCWLRVIQRLPADKRLYGPSHFGNGVIRAGTDEIRYRVFDGCQRIRRLVYKPERKIKLPKGPDQLLMCAIYGVDASGVVSRGTRYRSVVRYGPYFNGEAYHDRWI